MERKVYVPKSPLERFHMTMRREGIARLEWTHRPRYIDLPDDRVRVICICGWRGPSVEAPATKQGRDLDGLPAAYTAHRIEQEE